MPITILVIDNDPAHSSIICTTIKDKLNHNVIAVSTPQEAKSYFSSESLQKPDLILFDISKIEDPQEIVSSFRRTGASTPIIVLASYGDYENAIAAVNAGANDFLNKPVAVERMDVTFRNAMLLKNNNLGFAKSNVTNMIEFSLFSDDGNIRRMTAIEAEAIKCVMQLYRGRMTDVAKHLGIGRSTLYRKISDFNIPHPSGKKTDFLNVSPVSVLSR